jgi:AraC-like DNA-binding protein
VTYREHAPPPALAPWLACTWERRAGDAARFRILPDGCIDVVWTEGAGTQLVGANTTAFLVSVPAGTRVIGARLRPGAGPALLGISGEGMRDVRVPVAEVWGDAGRRLAAALDEAADPLAVLRSALHARAAGAEPPDPLVRAAVAQLARPAVAVAAVADGLGVSERQLRRRVSVAVGYGPKRLARVFRLARALAAARDGDELARAALDAGFADQAHFANDCRALAGAPPSAVLAPGA